MSYTVLILDDAQQDLRDIHAYIRGRFSTSLANDVYQNIKNGILSLENHPKLGTTVPQLSALGMTDYRHMVVMKKNRVVYELDNKNALVYVYLVCTERQDYDTLVRRRILRR